MRPPHSFAKAGDTVLFTVLLSGPAVGNEVIYVDSSAGAFSNIPSTVTPAQGNEYVIVTGTLSQNPGSQVMVEASTEENSVHATIAIAQAD